MRLTLAHNVYVGIGWKTGRKLKELGVETCGQLARLSAHSAKEQFGAKNGEQLLQFARGVDDRPLKNAQQRQSVSAEVSWGVRFDHIDKVSWIVCCACSSLKSTISYGQ